MAHRCSGELVFASPSAGYYPPMKEATKVTAKLVFVLFMVVACVWSFQARGGKEIIPWRLDLDFAKVEATRAHKPLFVYFTASWCGPCQQLKRTTWADAKVEAKLRRYVPVKVDIDAFKQLAESYRINSVPTLIIMNAEGETIKRIEGAMRPDELIPWLE